MQYHAPLTCAVAVIRWGRDASSDVLRERARCARFGIYDRRHHWLTKYYGAEPIAGFDREAVKMMRDLPEFENKPSVGDAAIERLATLWDFAEEFLHIDDMRVHKGINPARNIRKLKTGEAESAPLWPTELCRAFEAYPHPGAGHVLLPRALCRPAPLRSSQHAMGPHRSGAQRNVCGADQDWRAHLGANAEAVGGLSGSVATARAVHRHVAKDARGAMARDLADQRIHPRDAQRLRDEMYKREVFEAAIEAAGNVTRLRSA